MPHKQEKVIVLFNPSFACVEQVLEFLTGYNGVSSKLHIINELETGKKRTEEDLLILELSLPKPIGALLIKYLNNLYPSLNKIVLDKAPKQDSDKRSYMANKAASHLSLKNHGFYLN